MLVTRLIDVQRTTASSMTEDPVIHLSGRAGSLFFGVIERLLRTNASLVLERQICEQIESIYSTDLEFGQASVSSAALVTPKQDDMLLFFGAELPEEHLKSQPHYPEGMQLIHVTHAHEQQVRFEWATGQVVVHDMIPHRNDQVSTPKLFTSWLESFQEGEEITPEESGDRWWVSEIDVADALVRLLLSSHPFPSECKMLGRRSWSTVQTLEEFQLLYKRTSAGRSGAFGIEELTAAPAPVIEVQPLIVTDAPPMSLEESMAQRPDLSPVHEALHKADGDGWRPLVPIRTSLMHCLAGMLDGD